jgi:CRP/FNR family transcriptional regulator, dissimilatory nitrate respiration regulator
VRRVFRDYANLSKMNASLGSLKHVPLFAGLNEEELKEIRAIGVPMQVAKGEILFSDCEESNGLYVLLSGNVKLYKVSPEGKEQIIHVISPPDTFAEASVSLRGSHPFYAETLSDCRLLFLPKRDLHRVLKKRSRLSANMNIALSQYVKRYASLIEDLSLKEVPSRIARYLLDISFRQSKEAKSIEEVELDLNRSQLASRLGTIRETLSKNLAKMKAKGIIDVKKNRIVILDRENLEKVASGLKS